ncbi:ankyrin repeat domain-containing protein 49-like [Helianthus annuus]|uniref:ankyrin repeat domain-containing protein 49-like n=1 Tax=Helianthus annuus TaxID=4232 RepID=UPI000B8F1EF2|nr:ankyrin repeat domain-containing protein 49-like [Helianthus annuus]
MDQQLIQAAWNGDVDYLLKELDRSPSTLHAVVLEATVIKLRLEFSRELNHDGFSPLHIAAACGHVEIVRELLRVAFDLCLIKGKENRKIPLHLAFIKYRFYRVHTAQVISKEKMELNSINKYGLTPLDILLMFQSESGDREIIEILNETGALKADKLKSQVDT